MKDVEGATVLGAIGEPCKRYLTRRVRRGTYAKCDGDYWLFCERNKGHKGPHVLVNGVEFTDEGAWAE
ncbi:hypothetical protein BH790_gp49 [Gordonia phage Gsput1]|uniref:Uncharacterized protein n=1 Tax=Gordonia phage Gsput1 TaxID=1622193 RepID=A0A0E3T702_9CAUD|nr:hypothetical protein BH790_gp49 [Gordonia phage Gsput1]AKC03074.1 hypothetical protein Gsput1_49 [Gordonia phage Gsput1]